ncbi:MAG TPA: iron-containing alcohol dehydrogenase [Geminicoccaceae bacterium]|nr:iron-containing alcohol dehydrogenase [Geminicoccus sp.]HMU50146.1 iron-containing alcohol dehydrogenase [Geminicoccaceae bacterium]
MAAAFSLARIPRITHGPGAVDRLGELAAPHASARPVLLVADPGLHRVGTIARAEAALRAGGLEPVLFDDVRSDPTTAQTDRAAALARTCRAAAVVAIGGGSALDLGKAAAAIAPGEAPAAAYALCAMPLPASPLAKICVPTTAGTGSETTRTAVLSDDGGVKLWLWGDGMKADEVLLDPELSVSLPPHLTAATGIDALVHAIEAATNRNAFPANDLYAHEAIRQVGRWLPLAVAEPENLEARSGMLLAAALAGIAIDNAGTALAHNIGHALASLVPIHHGRAVGIAMAATLAWTSDVEDAGRCAAAEAALGRAGALSEAFRHLACEVGLDLSLAIDLRPERLAAQMARPENAPMRLSTRRTVRDEDLLPLARTVLGGQG